MSLLVRLREARLVCSALSLFMVLAAWTQARPVSADLLGSLDLGASAGINWEPIRKWVAAGQMDQARRALEAIVAADPQNDHPEVLLARALWEQGRTAQGTQLLETLARDAGDRLDVTLAFAQLAVAQRRWYDARALLEQAKTATVPPAWQSEYTRIQMLQAAFLRASCSEGQQRWSDAAEAYRKLMEHQATPESMKAGAAHGNARCLAALDDQQQALLAYRTLKTVSQRPESAERLLARQLRGYQKHQAAEDWYRAALLIADDYEPARRELAQFLLWLNRPDELAELLVEPAEETSDARIERLYLLALAARMQRRDDEAYRLLLALNQEEPTRLAISNQLALVLIENADPVHRDRALQIARTNVSNHPQASEAWATLGWIQLRHGDAKSAGESLINACRGGSISRDTAYYIAVLGDKLGQNTPLIQQMKAAAIEASGPFFYAEIGPDR